MNLREIQTYTKARCFFSRCDGTGEEIKAVVDRIMEVVGEVGPQSAR